MLRELNTGVNEVISVASGKTPTSKNKKAISPLQTLDSEPSF